MLKKGTSFILNGHLWFNLTEPTAQNSHVLCVNLTCLDDECPDDECQITHVDYGFVKIGYPTAVAFSRARVWDSNNIIKHLGNGTLGKPGQGDVPAATVSKVVKIARTSRELSKDFKALL